MLKKGKKLDDLDLIGEKYKKYEIPKNRNFLLKYFKKPKHVAFLKYYMCYGHHRNFQEVTGYYLAKRYKFRLQKKYHILIDAYDNAKKTLSEENMELILKIETGKYRVTKYLT